MDNKEALNKDFLREYIVEILFLQNNLFIYQPRDHTINDFVEASRVVSEFYRLLLCEIISEEEKKSFDRKLTTYMSFIFELEHESNDIPQMEDILPLQYQIEKKKYFKEMKEFLDDEYDNSEEGKLKKEFFKGKNVVSSLEELFNDK